MLKVAITGNIASGKSTVEKFISEMGWIVFDTDKIAHEILESNDDVKNLFGTSDRHEIAKIVFIDMEKLKKLESIIHPLVKEKLLKIFQKDYDIVFVSVPQLFEAGFEDLFDKIIYITAERNIRKKRLMERNNLTSQEAQIRIDAQDDRLKKERSDFVIINDSDLKNLKEQVKKILCDLILI